MSRHIVVAIAVIALVPAVAGATSERWFTTHPGDKIKTSDHQVACATTKQYRHVTIACAPISSRGHVIVVVSKLGISVVIRNKVRLTCLSDGYCKRHR